MKYLAIIFSLYIAALTVMPCQDAVDFQPGLETNSHLSKPSKDFEHNGQETCPPFCSCTCCSVSRDFIVSAQLGIIFKQIAIPYTQYMMPALPEQVLDIYQPPQIV